MPYWLLSLPHNDLLAYGVFSLADPLTAWAPLCPSSGHLCLRKVGTCLRCGGVPTVQAWSSHPRPSLLASFCYAEEPHSRFIFVSSQSITPFGTHIYIPERDRLRHSVPFPPGSVVSPPPHRASRLAGTICLMCEECRFQSQIHPALHMFVLTVLPCKFSGHAIRSRIFPETQISDIGTHSALYSSHNPSS